MKNSDAWHFVAELANTAVTTEDDRLALSDALMTLALAADLPLEASTCSLLSSAIRERDQRQLEFAALLNPQSAIRNPKLDGRDGQ